MADPCAKANAHVGCKSRYWGVLLAAVLAGPMADAQPSPHPPESREGAQAAAVLARMHIMSRLVIEAAGLAPDRTERGDVRDYAERLEMDHAFASRKVQILARELDVELEARVREMRLTLARPRQLGASAADVDILAAQALEQMKQLGSSVERLERLQGMGFDRTFVQVMRAAHRSVVSNLSMVGSRAEVEPLQDMLSALVPIFAQHAALAEVLLPDLQS